MEASGKRKISEEELSDKSKEDSSKAKMAGNQEQRAAEFEYTNQQTKDMLQIKSAPDVARQGFDANLIIETFIKRGMIASRNFLDDLLSLITLYVVRGNNINKILKSIKPEVARKYEEMVRIYKIQSQVTGGEGSRKERVTLSRLAACMPHYACYFMAKRTDCPTVVDPGDLPPYFPRGMQVTVFPSIIPPTSVHATKLLDAHLVWSVEFNAVISRGQRKKSALPAIRKYQTIAHNSTVVNDAKKTELMISLGLISDKNQLHAAIILAAYKGRSLYETVTETVEVLDAAAALKVLVETDENGFVTFQNTVIGQSTSTTGLDQDVAGPSGTAKASDDQVMDDDQDADS